MLSRIPLKVPPKTMAHSTYSPIFYESDYEAARYLCIKDRRLSQIINRVGPIKRRIWPDPYAALLRAIIGQQISAKAQDSIWLRFCATFPSFDPHELAQADIATIGSCGISRRKAAYMQGISAAFASNALSAPMLAAMTDAEISKALGTLKGIGSWTVEMLLIFTFQRPNVLSFGDLAIQRALCRLYGHERITREIFQRHYECYSPQATLAGMYLWEVGNFGDKL